MKATWRGYITLGQLGVPVRLFPAVRSARPDFVLVHEEDGSPVERVLRRRSDGREISSAETLRAVEHGPGRYVTFTPRELAATGLDQPKTIDIKQFSAPSDISPAYYEKPYYIVPSKGGERAYSLLREALQRSGQVAIAEFAIYNKYRIGAISSTSDILMLHQLRFAAELTPRSSISSPAIPKANPSEIEVLAGIIDRFSGPFYIEDYRDEQTERVKELVERKIKGLPMPKTEREDLKGTADEDLLPVLRSTLDGAGPTISRSTARKPKSHKRAKQKG